MHFGKTLAAAVLGFGVRAAMAQAPAPAPAAPFVTHQLPPSVYWIDGGGGNSGVIVGKKGVIVIDAKITAAAGKELLDDIAKITPKPVTTVIETHSDRDHISGLASFPKGITIVAHENNKKEQEAAIKAGNGAVTSDLLPTQLVTKTKETLKIDGVTIEVYHWGPAHTSGDLVVYLPAGKIVFTGDICSPAQPDPIIHPEKNGSSEGWIATTKAMAALNSDRFVPGHGDVQTKAQIQAGLDKAVAKRAKIKELVAQGKSLDEIRKALGDPPAGRIITFTEVVYKELTAAPR
jgi:glyoxylase-like metal-dependent hydrolase (beta-lactamase superfamily II)